MIYRSRTPSFLVCALAAGLGAATFPGQARAQGESSASVAAEPLRVYVGALTGAKPTSVRNWIVQGLENSGRYDVLAPDEPEIESGASEEQIATYAAEVQADVVILGRSQFGGGWSAELSIHDGSDGRLIGTHPIEGGSWDEYEAELKGGAFTSLFDQATGFSQAEPEPERESEPGPPSEETESAATGAQAPADRPEPLRITAGVRLYSRSFRYRDSLAQLGVSGVEPLESYNLDAGPMPLLHAVWYPGAHFTSNALAHIGVSAGYEIGVGTRVRYVDDAGEAQTFSQNHQLMFGGIKGRIPLDWVTFGVLGHVGHHLFRLSGKSDGANPEGLFPNVGYTFVEAGADFEVQVGRVLLGAHGAYLAVLDSGDIAAEPWFPQASAFGVHYGATAGVAVTPSLDLLAGVDARLIAFDFNPIDSNADPAVTPIAGGATDRYLSASLSLRFRLPGQSDAQGRGGADSEGDGGSDSGNGEDSFDSFDSFD